MSLLGPHVVQTFGGGAAPVAVDRPPGEVGARLRFPRDEEIFAQDEEADLLYRVICGVVRTTRLANDGRRHVGDFYYPGEFFGLQRGETHRFSAEALTDCEVLVLRRARAIDGDPVVQRLIWEATSQELERARERLMLLGRRTAFERVAGFLLDAAGRADGDPVELPMGRQDIADYLGLTVETVSRMITQLQADGAVTFLDCRHFRILRRAALAQLLG